MWEDDEDDDCPERIDPMQCYEMALLNTAHPDWNDHIRMCEDGSIGWASAAMSAWLAGPGNSYRSWAASPRASRAIAFMDKFKAWKGRRPQLATWQACGFHPSQFSGAKA